MADNYELGTARRLDLGTPDRNRGIGDPKLTLTAPSQREPTVNPETPAPMPLPRDLKHVIYKVRNRINDFVPILFVDLIQSVEKSQQELTANAKLEAALKTKKALDIAKVLDSNTASQQIVAPENMATLLNPYLTNASRPMVNKPRKS
jgi:hypothetical protein